VLFTVANRLDEVFNQFPEAPRVFILKYRPTLRGSPRLRIAAQTA